MEKEDSCESLFCIVVLFLDKGSSQVRKSTNSVSLDHAATLVSLFFLTGTLINSIWYLNFRRGGKLGTLLIYIWITSIRSMHLSVEGLAAMCH